jgi:hypothetical protein
MNNFENILQIFTTPEGYNLRKSVGLKENKLQYEEILRRGTLSDVIRTLVDIPDEFYKKLKKVDYGNPDWPLQISKEEKEKISGLISIFQEIALQ